MTLLSSYDLVIIGAGSAGLPAGMYASRYQLSNLIIGEMPGGALSTSHCVENYPGILSASGREIMDSFQKHAEQAGSHFLMDRVETLTQTDEGFSIQTLGGSRFTTRRIILATGNTYKTLGVPGEQEYYGQGVSYCATCDGAFYKKKVVALVGAGNTALTEALYLAEIAETVHILVRTDVIRAENVWIDRAKNTPNIIFHLSTQIEKVNGDMMGVTGVTLTTGESLALDGVFVAIGSRPITTLVDPLSPQKDAEGCLVIDARQETSIPGLYAAGDVTTGSHKFRQTIMSAAEGCLAAHSVHEDIMRMG